jgi:hypothetical protein
LAIESYCERRHQFVIARFLGILEELFDDSLMAWRIERGSEIGKNLLPGPRAWILLPTIDKRAERFGLMHLPHRGQQQIIFSGEVFLHQEHRTTFVSRSCHEPLFGDAAKILSSNNPESTVNE